MKKISIGSGGAIIKDKKLLLTKRISTKKQFPNFWTFPAGRYEESDELLENTAIREAKEEVNLDFKPIKKLNFYEFQNENFLNVSHIYLGEWSGEVIFQKEEITEIGWFSYEETKELNIAFAYREVIEDLHKLDLIE
jgi:ADP-ribose pyrophosphatase YjhB (NUDIX family)